MVADRHSKPHRSTPGKDVGNFESRGSTKHRCIGHGSLGWNTRNDLSKDPSWERNLKLSNVPIRGTNIYTMLTCREVYRLGFPASSQPDFPKPRIKRRWGRHSAKLAHASEAVGKLSRSNCDARPLAGHYLPHGVA
jgi:hypothetical protein